MTMASKKAAPTDDELLAQLDSLSAKPASSRSAKAANRSGKQSKDAPAANKENDLLAELGSLAQRPASRPSTPSLRPSASNTPVIGGKSPQPSAAGPPQATLTSTTSRQSEDKASNGQRKSGDSNRSNNHQSFTPATTATEESPEPELQPAPVPTTKSGGGGGGGWWGGFLSTATAAVTQAQAKVKDIQQSEDAKRWAEQVRGNVGVLRGFGDELKSRAMPTFQNILQTIAPPISSHERLQIYVTHDLEGYPSLDPTVYAVFSRVMAQVEGGDLMVIQKGSEAPSSRGSHESHRPKEGSWRDGPWWRSAHPRKINAVRGVLEGSKLARAAAEAYSSDYFTQKGGVEAAAQKATEQLNETNPTRDSEIFLAIQAIITAIPEGLFAAGPSSSSSSTEKSTDTPAATDADADKKPQEEISFAVYLHDPVHGITFSAVSQSLPGQWIEWLDAPSGGEDVLPASIEGIIADGGIDPREWVSEWVEETLSLAVGTVAQRYVARRMGVGEPGAHKKGGREGVLRPDRGAEGTVESGGGEAARAMGGM